MWVVEETLAKGKSHIVPRRRLYIDEDTWFAVYSDSWDDEGRLWKFGHATMYNVPDLLAVILGSQFTSFEFTGVLKDAGIAISMNGRGRFMDNIFIERLWRSLKYEAVYLHEMVDGFVAESVIVGLCCAAT